MEDTRKSLLVYVTQLMPTGGIESHILEFCEKMSSDGTKITLVVPNLKFRDAEKNRLAAACHKMYAGSLASGIKSKLWLLSKAFRLAATRFDALYTNGQGESIGLFGKLIRKKKWVHHHHTSGDKDDQNSWGSLYRQALKMADVVVACAKRNAADMKEALHRPIDVIYCFSRKIVKQPSLSKKIKGKVRLGYYGRLIKEKGIEFLCKLSNDAESSNIEINVWGQGENYPASFFEDYPNLKFHGAFQGLRGLEGAINQLDGFLLVSSHPEGLPVCLLEAMGAGLPWLATDRGGIPDIVSDPKTTPVIPADLTYSKTKDEVLKFAKHIANNEADSLKQIKWYDQKFAAGVLVKEWKEVFDFA